MHSIIFDGSFEGFLCVVYAYYYDKIVPSHIQREDEYQETLDAESVSVNTDQPKAARVLEGINRKISPEAAKMVFFACLSGEDDIYMDIFKYTVLGFRVGALVDSYLQTDYVRRVHTLHKRVGHETHMLTGFCRFQETRQGVPGKATQPPGRGQGRKKVAQPLFQPLRLALVLLSSLLAACVTAFAGPVSFVGIAVPHLIRWLFGTAKPLVVIPGCFLGGAVFCLGCDLLARTVFIPTEINISSVTAVFGAPIVIAIMLRRRRGQG